MAIVCCSVLCCRCLLSLSVALCCAAAVSAGLGLSWSCLMPLSFLKPSEVMFFAVKCLDFSFICALGLKDALALFWENPHLTVVCRGR